VIRLELPNDVVFAIPVAVVDDEKRVGLSADRPTRDDLVGRNLRDDLGIRVLRVSRYLVLGVVDPTIADLDGSLGFLWRLRSEGERPYADEPDHQGGPKPGHRSLSAADIRMHVGLSREDFAPEGGSRLSPRRLPKES